MLLSPIFGSVQMTEGETLLPVFPVNCFLLAQGRDNLILLIPPGPANVWCMASAEAVPEGWDAMKQSGLL